MLSQTLNSIILKCYCRSPGKQRIIISPSSLVGCERYFYKALRIIVVVVMVEVDVVLLVLLLYPETNFFFFLINALKGKR